MDSLDKTLQIEALKLNQDEEISRVLSCCEWDYFSILEINPLMINIDDLNNIVKRSYRKKSLFIHPDKTSNKDSELAFDRLKKAEQVLSIQEQENSETTIQNDTPIDLINEKKRLIDIYNDVGKDYSDKSTDFNSEPWKQLRQGVMKILNEEMKFVKVEKDYQQRQEAIRLAEIKAKQQERELKKKFDNKWEDERDLRVNSWRKYTDKVEKVKHKGKKKSKKLKVLA